MSTTILMTRHGETDAIGRAMTGRKAGVPLNRTGLHQAEELAARLSNLHLHAIYTSPMERTIQTAQPTSKLLGIEARQLSDLTEIDVGEWSGATFEALEPQERWQRFNTFRSGVRPPGGELMLDAQVRIITALLRIGEQHDGQVVAVFSHADVIKAAIMYFLGMPIDLHWRLDIAPASISAVTLGSENCRVLWVNDLGGNLASRIA